MASRSGTRSKIHALFSSFLHEKEGHIKDRKELGTDITKDTAGALSTLCQPRNIENFYSRVETFSPFTWFMKPLYLSPQHCALYGWENTDVDLLTCVSCKATLDGMVPTDWDTEIYNTTCSNLKTNIINGHSKFCPWKDSPCPESFLCLPARSMEEWKEYFQSACKNLLGFEDDLPVLKREAFQDMELTEDILSILSSNMPECDSTLYHQDIVDTVSVMALCGWNSSNTNNPGVLCCSACHREAGVWNFLSLKSVSQIKSGAKSDNTGHDQTSEEQPSTTIIDRLPGDSDMAGVAQGGSDGRTTPQTDIEMTCEENQRSAGGESGANELKVQLETETITESNPIETQMLTDETMARVIQDQEGIMATQEDTLDSGTAESENAEDSSTTEVPSDSDSDSRKISDQRTQSGNVTEELIDTGASDIEHGIGRDDVDPTGSEGIQGLPLAAQGAVAEHVVVDDIDLGEFYVIDAIEQSANSSSPEFGFADNDSSREKELSNDSGSEEFPLTADKGTDVVTVEPGGHVLPKDDHTLSPGGGVKVLAGEGCGIPESEDNAKSDKSASMHLGGEPSPGDVISEEGDENCPQEVERRLKAGSIQAEGTSGSRLRETSPSVSIMEHQHEQQQGQTDLSASGTLSKAESDEEISSLSSGSARQLSSFDPYSSRLFGTGVFSPVHSRQDSLIVEVGDGSLAERLESIESELVETCDDCSEVGSTRSLSACSDKDSGEPSVKRLRTQGVEKNEFNVLTEHRNWCPWVAAVPSLHGPSSDENFVQRCPGWQILLKHLSQCCSSFEQTASAQTPPSHVWKSMRRMFYDCQSTTTKK